MNIDCAFVSVVHVLGTYSNLFACFFRGDCLTHFEVLVLKLLFILELLKVALLIKNQVGSRPVIFSELICLNQMLSPKASC